jgi:hypothetical protein
MTPYAAQYISSEELALFSQIRKTIQQMRDPDLGLDEKGEQVVLSCHILARAISKVFPVQVRDGYFAGSYDHSWVVTSSGHLIDLYPVGVIGGPIMFEGSRASPQKRIYKRASAKELSRGRFSKNSFRRAVRRVVKLLREQVSNAR